MYVKKSVKRWEICKIQAIALNQSGCSSSQFRLTSTLKVNKSHTLTMATLQLATQSSSIVASSSNASAPGPPRYTPQNWMHFCITVQRLCPSCFEMQLHSSHEAVPPPFPTLHHCGQMVLSWSKIFFQRLLFESKIFTLKTFSTYSHARDQLGGQAWCMQTAAEGCLHSYRQCRDIGSPVFLFQEDNSGGCYLFCLSTSFTKKQKQKQNQKNHHRFNFLISGAVQDIFEVGSSYKIFLL